MYYKKNINVQVCQFEMMICDNFVE